jgi:rubrerythrin
MSFEPAKQFATSSSGVRREGLVSEQEVMSMANPVPAGSDVSAGTYRCTQCGYELDVASTQHLPPCPSCGNGAWSTVSGGDAADDPYPDRA